MTREKTEKFVLFSASDGNVNALNRVFGISNYTIDFKEWIKPSKK